MTDDAPSTALTRTRYGSVPSPDPTILTTDALHREVTALERLLDNRIGSLERSVREERDMLNRERMEQFAALREILEARLSAMGTAIALQFDLVERQRVEQKIDTKSAVDAALIAQKEAVREQTTASERAIAKSETATTKQLEQQQITFATTADSLRRAIDEVKERASEEGRNLRTSISEVATSANGIVQQKVGAKEDRSSLYATITIFAVVTIALLAVIGFLATRVP